MPLDLNTTPVSPLHPHNQNNKNGTSLTEVEPPLKHDQPQKDDFLKAIHSAPLSQPRTHLINVHTNKKNQASYQPSTIITTFSYDKDGLIHTGNQQFLSLRPLVSRPDIIGFDLAHQIDQAVFRDESVDQALDGLLISLVDFLDNADPKERIDHCRGVLSAGLITWRGTLAKLFSSMYDNRRGGEGAYTKEVMMVDGTVYMADGPYEKKPGPSLEQRYYGYSYENLVTSPAGRVPPVNTNAQWVAVVKAKLNRTRIILGGEVDCIESDAFNNLHQRSDHVQKNNSAPLQPHQFIEIKTSILPSSEHEYCNLYRYKLLNLWIQSYLLGVPRIHVGMRDREGIIRAVQEYKTNTIPALVRQSQRDPRGRWSADACLEAGAEIVEFVLRRLRVDRARSAGTRLAKFEARLQEIIGEELARHRRDPQMRGLLSERCRAQIASLAAWPVYSLVFHPATRPGQPGSFQLFERASHPLSSSATYSDSLLGYQHPLRSTPPAPSRMGFLPSLWFNYLVRTRIDLALDSNPTSS